MHQPSGELGFEIARRRGVLFILEHPPLELPVLDADPEITLGGTIDALPSLHWEGLLVKLGRAIEIGDIDDDVREAVDVPRSP